MAASVNPSAKHAKAKAQDHPQSHGALTVTLVVWRLVVWALEFED